MRKITVVLAYYENPTMLERQFCQLRDVAPAIKEWLELIVVDDGSPRWPAAHPKHGLGFPVRLFRMEVDVRWNQDAARNVGAQHATADSWLLLTDMDHLIPEPTLRRAVAGPLDPRTVYRFGRVSEPDLEPYKPHPNSWLVKRRLYWAAGGYDERFAGYYGTDSDFRDRIAAVAQAVQILPEVLIRVPREVTPDASTTAYQRKTEDDIANIRRIRDDRRRIAGWRPVNFRFPYHEVRP